MCELVRTQDPVLISFLQALLSDAGIDSYVMDGHMAVLQGSIDAIPRRLMVLEEDYSRARRVLEEGGHGQYCRA